MSTKEGFREKKLRNHTLSVFNEDGKRGYLWHNWYLSHLKHVQDLTLEQPYAPLWGRSPKCKHPTTWWVWEESTKPSVDILLCRFHFSVYFYSIYNTLVQQYRYRHNTHMQPGDPACSSRGLGLVVEHSLWLLQAPRNTKVVAAKPS